MTDRPQLKQYGDLKASDFEGDPVWVQCHTMDFDAPWYEETDEETFRPWREASPVDPGAGMFLVRARFRFADGSEGWGFATPQPGGAPEDVRDLGGLQPTLIIKDGHVGFWTGIRRYSEEERKAIYERLERSPDQVFPLRFSIDVHLVAGSGQGEIPGFCSIPDFRNVQVDW